jgi:uncharacterized protein YgiM (DUF1202 family)
MRYRHILPVACFCLVTAATGASAAMLSLPVPVPLTAFQTIADRQMEVAVDNTHLRSKPASNSTKLATLKIGTKVDVVGMVNGGTWAHVKVDGKAGYIRADLLK